MPIWETNKGRFVDELLSEKEQVEQLRAWWQENGKYIIGGVVLGVGLLVGWNQWQGSERESQMNASALYEALMGEIGDGDLEAAELAANQLHADYAATAYAPLARLAMARLYMDKGRDADAADTLSALTATDASQEVLSLGKLRLAKVLLYQDKAAQVVELLKDETDSAYSARFNEVLGDAYVALGQFDDAADAYAIATADDPDLPTVDRTLVQMKINDLPEVGKTPAIDNSLKAEPAGSDTQVPEPQADESASGQ